jgi:hypothetical protein
VLGLVQFHVAAITAHTAANMSSFGVQLYEDLNIDHLYCLKHDIQLTAQLKLDDKQYIFDVSDSHCKLTQNFKAIVGPYRSYKVNTDSSEACSP